MPFQKSSQSNDKTKGDAENRVCLGKIAAPHGVKGLVKILAYGEDPYLIEAVQEHNITLKNKMGKYILAEVENCHSREDAEKLKGTELYLNKDALPPIDDEDTFYYADLIGLSCCNEKGEDEGRVLAVHNFGAGDMLEVQPPGGDSYLLPFSNDTIAAVKENITLSSDAARYKDL